ncbi:MAG: hypothetical protein WBA74_14415 [Cyclobacteriaceae bacterium]
MLKKISEVKGAKGISKDAQKKLNGGLISIERRCGGDGSFIYVDGRKVCCFVPSRNWYIC